MPSIELTLVEHRDSNPDPLLQAIALPLAYAPVRQQSVTGGSRRRYNAATRPLTARRGVLTRAAGSFCSSGGQFSGRA